MSHSAAIRTVPRFAAGRSASRSRSSKSLGGRLSFRGRVAPSAGGPGRSGSVAPTTARSTRWVTTTPGSTSRSSCRPPRALVRSCGASHDLDATSSPRSHGERFDVGEPQTNARRGRPGACRGARNPATTLSWTTSRGSSRSAACASCPARSCIGSLGAGTHARHGLSARCSRCSAVACSSPRGTRKGGMAWGTPSWRWSSSRRPWSGPSWVR